MIRNGNDSNLNRVQYCNEHLHLISPQKKIHYHVGIAFLGLWLLRTCFPRQLSRNSIWQPSIKDSNHQDCTQFQAFTKESTPVMDVDTCSRRPHKKSRKGCKRCKLRKVKVFKCTKGSASVLAFRIRANPISCANP